MINPCVTFSIGTLLALGSTMAGAQMLNCESYRVSGATMPQGFAQQCASPAVAGSAVAPDSRFPTDLGYTIDIFGSATRPRDTLYSFPLNDFSGQGFVNNTTQQVQGMDFSPSTTELFAVTARTAPFFPGALGVIFQQAGDFVPVGQITGIGQFDEINGFAVDPRSGAAYLSTSGGALARLYSINLNTAAATLIGTMNAPTDPNGTVMIALAINCDGDLYAHNITDNALYQVNRATAQASFVGSHGFDSNFAQGMDFDNSDGQLYAFMMLNSAENRFGRINTQTGAFTTLANNNPPGEYEGAIKTVCPEAVSLFADGFEG